eukprot:GHVP01000021.1.p1 GENE.GHVP01000021.1~~GHVP01000021.1.p1  ORF type:complete len:128 (-),score=15.68 GHVP01000021.1:59-442(-)
MVFGRNISQMAQDSAWAATACRMSKGIASESEFIGVGFSIRAASILDEKAVFIENWEIYELTSTFLRTLKQCGVKDNGTHVSVLSLSIIYIELCFGEKGHKTKAFLVISMYFMVILMSVYWRFYCIL